MGRGCSFSTAGGCVSSLIMSSVNLTILLEKHGELAKRQYQEHYIIDLDLFGLTIKLGLFFVPSQGRDFNARSITICAPPTSMIEVPFWGPERFHLFMYFVENSWNPVFVGLYGR